MEKTSDCSFVLIMIKEAKGRKVKKYKLENNLNISFEAQIYLGELTDKQET